jgi:hypothetical protein
MKSAHSQVAKYVLETICLLEHIPALNWVVDFHDEFVPEYAELVEEVQDELLAVIEAIEQEGPHLGRPRVDTLNGSKHKNMKEIRFKQSDGVWRFAFAFDPNRQAIIFCGGDKSGGSEKFFYKQLIAKADRRSSRKHQTSTKKQKREVTHEQPRPHTEGIEP